MKKSELAIGVAFLVLAGVVFVFGDGARRIYSGVFFLILGMAVLANERRRKGGKAG